MPTVATVKLEIQTKLMWCGHYVALPVEAWAKSQDGNNQDPKLVCPYGDSWIYKTSEVEKLRTDLASVTAHRDRALERANKAERSLDGALGEISRIKRRARNGVCQDCHRSFRNVAQHVRMKHGTPDARKLAQAEVMAAT